MKILVTGGFGFLGSHFVDHAFFGGHDVCIVDALTYAGRSLNVADSNRHCFFNADIRDALAIDRIFRGFEPNWVVHFAAETHVTRSITCADEFLTTNVKGTHVVLEAALRFDVQRFVHVSTDEVYGSLGPAEAAWSESSPYAPRNPYAASKAASDHLVRAYRETFHLPACIVHASNCYGARQHPEKLIPTLIRQTIAGKPMTLHGDGQHRRDWLAAEDFVRGVYAVLREGILGETYNFPGCGELTNAQVAQLVSDAFGSKLPVEYTPDRPGNDRRYAMNGTKVRNAFNFKPCLDLRREIFRVASWYRRNPNYGSEYGR